MFVEWHRAVDIEPPLDVVGPRWTTIEKYLPSATRDVALQLLGLATGRDVGVFAQQFAEAFHRDEATFPMRSNDRLLQVLSAAACIHAMETRHQTATLVAYGTLTQQSGMSEWAVPDLLDHARAYLSEESSRRRTLASLAAPPKRSLTTKALTDKLAEIPSESDPGVASTERTAESIRLAIRVAEQAIEGSDAYSHEVFRWAETAIQSCREEVDLLWWLISGESKLLGSSWSEASPFLAAVVAAWEISALVTILPAPPSVEAMLTQTLARQGKAPKDSLKAAIDRLPAAVHPPSVNDATAPYAPVACLAAGRASNADRLATDTPEQVGVAALNEALMIRAYEDASDE